RAHNLHRCSSRRAPECFDREAKQPGKSRVPRGWSECCRKLSGFSVQQRTKWSRRRKPAPRLNRTPVATRHATLTRKQGVLTLQPQLNFPPSLRSFARRGRRVLSRFGWRGRQRERSQLHPPRGQSE